MRRSILVFALAAAVAAATSAREAAPQDTPPAKSTKPPGKGDTIIVTGCVRGSALESHETRAADSTGLIESAITFRMTGKKDLLKQLRTDHSSHLEEVTGVLKSVLPGENTMRGKQIGRTRIVIGAAPAGRSGPGEMHTTNVAVPVIEVQSTRHIAARCGA